MKRVDWLTKMLREAILQRREASVLEYLQREIDKCNITRIEVPRGVVENSRVKRPRKKADPLQYLFDTRRDLLYKLSPEYKKGEYAVLGLRAVGPCLVERNCKLRVAAFRAFPGKPPGKVCLCHRCDNPPCIEPTHLFWGTTRDNARDSVLKGRQRRKLPYSDIEAVWRAQLIDVEARLASIDAHASEALRDSSSIDPS